jgi:hypothetical protein
MRTLCLVIFLVGALTYASAQGGAAEASTFSGPGYRWVLRFANGAVLFRLTTWHRQKKAMPCTWLISIFQVLRVCCKAHMYGSWWVRYNHHHLTHLQAAQVFRLLQLVIVLFCPKMMSWDELIPCTTRPKSTLLQ